MSVIMANNALTTMLTVIMGWERGQEQGGSWKVRSVESSAIYLDVVSPRKVS